MEDCSNVSGLTTWRELRGRGAIGAVVKIVVLSDYMGGGGGAMGYQVSCGILWYCVIRLTNRGEQWVIWSVVDCGIVSVAQLPGGSNGVSVQWWIVGMCRWLNYTGGAMGYRFCGGLWHCVGGVTYPGEQWVIGSVMDCGIVSVA